MDLYFCPLSQIYDKKIAWECAVIVCYISNFDLSCLFFNSWCLSNKIKTFMCRKLMKLRKLRIKYLNNQINIFVELKKLCITLNKNNLHSLFHTKAFYFIAFCSNKRKRRLWIAPSSLLVLPGRKWDFSLTLF